MFDYGYAGVTATGLLAVGLWDAPPNTIGLRWFDILTGDVRGEQVTLGSLLFVQALSAWGHDYAIAKNHDGTDAMLFERPWAAFPKGRSLSLGLMTSQQPAIAAGLMVGTVVCGTLVGTSVIATVVDITSWTAAPPVTIGTAESALGLQSIEALGGGNYRFRRVEDATLTMQGVTALFVTPPNEEQVVLGQDTRMAGCLMADIPFGEIGTLAAVDTYEPRLAGSWWCVRSQQPPVIMAGLLPIVVPPLQPVPVPPIVIPTYGPFTHALSVAPFKDSRIPGLPTADSEVVVNQFPPTSVRPCWATLDSLWQAIGPLIGLYTEGIDLDPVLAEAEKRNIRVGYCQDNALPVTVPHQLRHDRDVIFLECYRYRSLPETADEAMARFARNLKDVRQKWAGLLGIIPMWYSAGGAPPHEDFTVAEVLAVHANLTALINSDGGVRVVAPFAVARANGISAHVEYQQAFAAFVTACRAAGTYVFPPLPHPPDPEPEPIPMPVPKRVLLPFACPGVAFVVTPLDSTHYSLVTAPPPDDRGCPAGLLLGSLPQPIQPKAYPPLAVLPVSNAPLFHLLTAAAGDQTTFTLAASGQFFINASWGAEIAVEYVPTL